MAQKKKAQKKKARKKAARKKTRVVRKVRSILGVPDVSPEPQVDIGLPNSRDTW